MLDRAAGPLRISNHALILRREVWFALELQPKASDCSSSLFSYAQRFSAVVCELDRELRGIEASCAEEALRF
jgi:hypothetical protein